MQKEIIIFYQYPLVTFQKSVSALLLPLGRYCVLLSGKIFPPAETICGMRAEAASHWSAVAGLEALGSLVFRSLLRSGISLPLKSAPLWLAEAEFF